MITQRKLWVNVRRKLAHKIDIAVGHVLLQRDQPHTCVLNTARVHQAALQALGKLGGVETQW